jgi:hypothetical protein
MRTSDLRALLDTALADDRPHVEKLTIAAAVISEVLRQHGMEATLVGGGAVEFHAPGTYATSDIDLVVEGRTREDLDAALTAFGFARRGRHWVLGDLFVEVPGNYMSDPVDVVAIGSLSLRVVRREVVLADRIIGFKHWRATAYGAQAIALLDALGDTIDEASLRHRLAEENAEDALDALRAVARDMRGTPVTHEALRAILDRLHAPGRRT